MGLDLDYADGQTPLEEDEREGLLIPSITTRAELDEFEQLGIEQAIAWTMEKSPTLEEILSEEFVRELHKRMFAGVWKWAGEFRTTNKNLGMDRSEIRIELKKLLDDCRYWIEHKVHSADEVAVRLSHRMVSIHPFTNGNGRHSRLLADVLVSDGLGQPHFTWGRARLTADDAARREYLAALRAADQEDFVLLVKFARW